MRMQVRGYSVPDPVSELCGSLTGWVALVCGNGEGVLEEVEVALRVIDEWPVFFGVNDVGAKLPTVQHWVSLHAENFARWELERQTAGLEMNYKTHTLYSPNHADYKWDGLAPNHFPLSGLLAMQLAWVMGAERIILCGCPGDDRARFNGTHNDSPGFAYGAGNTNSDRSVRELLHSEMARVPLFKAAVRSMSGNTRNFFGGAI